MAQCLRIGVGRLDDIDTLIAVQGHPVKVQQACSEALRRIFLGEALLGSDCSNLIALVSWGSLCQPLVGPLDEMTLASTRTEPDHHTCLWVDSDVFGIRPM